MTVPHLPRKMDMIIRSGTDQVMTQTFNKRKLSSCWSSSAFEGDCKQETARKWQSSLFIRFLHVPLYLSLCYLFRTVLTSGSRNFWNLIPRFIRIITIPFWIVPSTLHFTSQNLGCVSSCNRIFFRQLHYSVLWNQLQPVVKKKSVLLMGFQKSQTPNQPPDLRWC